MLTSLPIYHLTDNKVQRLKFSLIKRSLYNIRYERNPWNANFDDLTFDGDESLLARRRLYRINDNIVLGRSMVQDFTCKKIECKKNKSWGQCIDWLII